MPDSFISRFNQAMRLIFVGNPESASSSPDLLKASEAKDPSPATPAVAVDERRLNDDVLAIQLNQLQTGIADRKRPSFPQAEQAFRGLIHRCLSLRADGIIEGLQGLSVERETAQGEFISVEASHAWVQLLKRLNPNHSNLDIFEWTSLSRDLTGVADFLVWRDGRNVPIGLFPVYAFFGQLMPVGNNSGGIDHYVFYRADGEIIPIPAEDVVRLRHQHPLTPFESCSLIQAAAYQIDTDLAMRIYRRDSVKDGGLSSLVLSSEQDLSEAQMIRYGKHFKDRYFGIKGLKEVAVLGGGLKPHLPQLSAKDIEFVKGAQLNDTEIMQIMGVPEGMISDKANRANAEAARLTFYQNTIQSEIRKIASQLTHSFEISFKANPGVLQLRPPDLLPTNYEFDLRKDTEHVKSGLRSINEIRKRDGFDEIEGGDEILVPSNLIPLSSLMKRRNGSPAAQAAS